MSNTIATLAGSAGLGSERHAAWGPNSQLWWAFGYTGTSTLASWYSNDGATWSAGATHALSQAHNSEGRNLAVAIKSLNGIDTVQFSLPYKSGTSLGLNALRATISGTTITYHSSDTAVASATADSGALYWASSGLEFDGNNHLHLSNGWAANGNGDVNSDDSTVDAGTAEQMTPVSWTGHQVDSTPLTQNRSAYVVDKGGSNAGLICDDGASSSGTTGLSWFNWNGSSWDVVNSDNVAVTGTITSIDKNDWGAVFISPSNGHVVYREAGTGNLIHRRWDGNSWGAGQAVPAQTNLAGGGVALTTDGASVWAVVIDTDAANTVRSCQWSDLAHNKVGDQWGSWQIVESSSATRTFIGVVKDVAASVGLAYWSEGTNLVAATFPASSPPDPGFYTWVQSAQGSTGVSATTFAVAFSTQNVVVGNRIIVAVSEWNATATTVTSVTDTPGNSYVKDKDAVESDGTHISIWSAPIILGGGTKPTVTAHASASTNEWAMWVHEYSGVTSAPTNYLDGTNAFTTGVSSSPITSGASSPAPAAANELAFGFYGDGGNNIATIGVSAGWTQRGSSIQGTSTTAEGACEDQPTSVGVGSNASFTLSTTGSPAGVLVAVYQLTPSGGGGGVPSLARTLSKRLVWRGLRHPIPGSPPYPAVGTVNPDFPPPLPRSDRWRIARWWSATR